MTELITIGFDFRVPATVPIDDWSPERRRSCLLREVSRPLTACNSVWPCADERLVDLHHDRHGGDTLPPPIGWPSLHELSAAVTGLGLDPSAGTTIAIASPSLCWPRLRPARPPEVGIGWAELGWDVVDSSGHAALCDFGFDGDPRDDALRARWRAGLNRWHLFANEADAREFARWRARTLPSHGPDFHPLFLFELRTRPPAHGSASRHAPAPDCNPWETAPRSWAPGSNVPRSGDSSAHAPSRCWSPARASVRRPARSRTWRA
ncbi:MAG: hypothetical protein IT460_09015 [Planctomycetes bacterium]|nr:hypothetical protein [Planctomycetota bacterium]